MKIAALKARSVRGLPRTWPDLPIGQRGLIVYGPNGVGKSSIIDAIEFAISARTTVFPVNAQNVNWEKGAPHVRDGKPEISLEVLNGSRAFLLDASGIPQGIGDSERQWIQSGRNATFVLRRHMLLKFITAEPKERYELLEPFMNFGEFSEIENSLDTWKNTLKGAQDAIAAQIAQFESSFRTAFGLGPDEKIESVQLLEKLNASLKALGVPEASASELEDRLSILAKELGSQEQSQRLAKLGGLKASLLKLGLPRDISAPLEGLVEALRELKALLDE